MVEGRLSRREPKIIRRQKLIWIEEGQTLKNNNEEHDLDLQSSLTVEGLVVAQVLIFVHNNHSGTIHRSLCSYVIDTGNFWGPISDILVGKIREDEE